ncbi:hypothetical protein AgCh_029240 [Apium graveolens]
MDDIDEHLAFLCIRFSKIKFKKNFGAAKPNRNMVDKSKFKCFKCGLPGQFATDGLDEDEDVSYVNLALMAKSNETETSSSTNQATMTGAKSMKGTLYWMAPERKVLARWGDTLASLSLQPMLLYICISFNNYIFVDECIRVKFSAASPSRKWIKFWDVD